MAVVGELTCGFVKKDNAVDVFFKVRGGEEDVTIVTAIFVGIRDVLLFEFFMNTASGFVGGKDAARFKNKTTRNKFEFGVF